MLDTFRLGGKLVKKPAFYTGCGFLILYFAMEIAGALAQSSVTVPASSPRATEACTITSRANDVARIDLVRLGNGLYAHRGYDAGGRLLCIGEWNQTVELNREAAEILRAKGNNRATIRNAVSD